MRRRGPGSPGPGPSPLRCSWSPAPGSRAPRRCAQPSLCRAAPSPEGPGAERPSSARAQFPGAAPRTPPGLGAGDGGGAAGARPGPRQEPAASRGRGPAVLRPGPRRQLRSGRLSRTRPPGRFGRDLGRSTAGPLGQERPGGARASEPRSCESGSVFSPRARVLPLTCLACSPTRGSEEGSSPAPPHHQLPSTWASPADCRPAQLPPNPLSSPTEAHRGARLTNGAQQTQSKSCHKGMNLSPPYPKHKRAWLLSRLKKTCS